MRITPRSLLPNEGETVLSREATRADRPAALSGVSVTDFVASLSQPMPTLNPGATPPAGQQGKNQAPATPFGAPTRPIGAPETSGRTLSFALSDTADAPRVQEPSSSRDTRALRALASSGYWLDASPAGHGVPEIRLSTGDGRMTKGLSRMAPEYDVEDIEPPSPQPKSGSDLTILLVDDDDLVRPVIGDSLRDAGYAVVESHSAELALRLFTAGVVPRIDLLVSDVVMPGMDGPAMVAEFRALCAGLRVLFITGHPGRHSLRGERVLLKPFTNLQLANAVEACLRVA